VRSAACLKRERQSDGENSDDENSDGDNSVKFHVKSDRKKAMCIAEKNRLNTPGRELCSPGGMNQCPLGLRYGFRSVYNERLIDIRLEPEFPITG